MENDETQEDIGTSAEEQEVELDGDTNVAPEDTREYWEKKVKTLEAQKEHWKKKATTNTNNELKQPNTQSPVSREEAVLLAKGYELAEIDEAKKVSQIRGISLLEASEDDYIVDRVQRRKQTEISKRASLNASSNSPMPKAEKTIGEMSEEEHAAYFHKTMGNL